MDGGGGGNRGGEVINSVAREKRARPQAGA